MGVLNVTPDSFSDGDAVRTPEETVAVGVALVADGADVLDVGAVSTRPGAPDVSLEEEWRRLAPVLGRLREAVPVPISLDTTRADIVTRALSESGGIDLVNDVSALTGDAGLPAVIASYGLPVVLMHRRGTPANMQDDPHYDDAPAEVFAELAVAVERARQAGIDDDAILVDPGIGFGKRLEDNVALLSALPRLVERGHRVVLGCSRKSFLGALTGAPVGDRGHATTATTVLGALAGVDFLRVHDAAAARQALDVVSAVVSGIPDASGLT